jgi:hypothetical protein
MSKRLVLILTFSTLAIVSLIPKSNSLPLPDRPEWMQGVKFLFKAAKIVAPVVIPTSSSNVKILDGLKLHDLDDDEFNKAIESIDKRDSAGSVVVDSSSPSSVVEPQPAVESQPESISNPDPPVETTEPAPDA